MNSIDKWSNVIHSLALQLASFGVRKWIEFKKFSNSVNNGISELKQSLAFEKFDKKLSRHEAVPLRCLLTHFHIVLQKKKTTAGSNRYGCHFHIHTYKILYVLTQTNEIYMQLSDLMSNAEQTYYICSMNLS